MYHHLYRNVLINHSLVPGPCGPGQRGQRLEHCIQVPQALSRRAAVNSENCHSVLLQPSAS